MEAAACGRPVVTTNVPGCKDAVVHNSTGILVPVKNSRKLEINALLGPSRAMKGPLYITEKSNVHFKKGPDVGAEILFLLNQGEVVSVDRITPGSYHGSVEVEIDGGENVMMEGWVNRTDLKELNLNSIRKIIK